ncbi:hypothetical protein RMCBS344292_11163 [Rhizopus microsporus]|nr:hypothetical protein RMCBS344292_11163 [Rhizopus microsporus]
MQATTVYYTATYPSPYPDAESQPASTTTATTTTTTATNNTPSVTSIHAAQDMTSAPLGNGIKRKQVKNACTNCQKACKKCDDARPCPRCIKYGIADTCVNSVRKERKKGIKRGPYRRRQKQSSVDGSKEIKPEFNPSNAASNTGPNTTSTTVSPSVAAAAPATPTPGLTAFGYPPNLNQYGQSYDAYYSVATGTTASSASGTPTTTAYSKDQIMQQQYVLPIYSPYPVLVSGNGTLNENNENNNTENGNHPSPYHHYELLQQTLQNEVKSSAPSTTNSSFPPSPTEHQEDDDTSKFARLTQLCSAALKENKAINEPCEHKTNIEKKD